MAWGVFQQAGNGWRTFGLFATQAEALSRLNSPNWRPQDAPQYFEMFLGEVEPTAPDSTTHRVQQWYALRCTRGTWGVHKQSPHPDTTISILPLS